MAARVQPGRVRAAHQSLHHFVAKSDWSDDAVLGLAYDIRFCWFVGLSMDASVWDVTVFTKNRDRLPEGNIARKFLAEVVADPKIMPLLSDEHFSFDGAMKDARASMKSFRPKGGSGGPPALGCNGEGDFHGKMLSNEMHASTTDPGARLYKKAKGQPARLCHLGHVIMENRQWLGGRGAPHPGHRHRRAGGRRRHGRGAWWRPAHHARYRQGL